MHKGMTVVETVEEMLGLMQPESRLNFIPVSMWKSVLTANPVEPTTYVVADTVTNSALLCLYTPRRPFSMPIDFHPRELTPDEVRLISCYGAIDEVVDDHQCAAGCQLATTPVDTTAPRCPHCEVLFCSPSCYLESIRAHVKGGGCAMRHSVFAKYFVGVRCIENEPMPLVPSPVALLLTPYCVRTVPRDWGTEFYFIDPTTLRHFVALTSTMQPEMAKVMLGYKGNFSHPTRVEMDFLETVNFATMVEPNLAGLSRAAQKQSIWIYRAKNFEYIRVFKVRQAMNVWKTNNHVSVQLLQRKRRQGREIMRHLFGKVCRALRDEAKCVATRSSKHHQNCLFVALGSFRRRLQYARSAHTTKLARVAPNHKHRLRLCFRLFCQKCIADKSYRQRAPAATKRAGARYVTVASRKVFYVLRAKLAARRAADVNREELCTRWRQERLVSALAILTGNLSTRRKQSRAAAAATTVWHAKSLRQGFTRWRKVSIRLLKGSEERLRKRVANLQSELDAANARAAVAEAQQQLTEARHHEEKLKCWNMTTNAQLEVNAYKRRMDACKQYYMTCLQDAQSNMAQLFHERMEVAQKM